MLFPFGYLNVTNLSFVLFLWTIFFEYSTSNIDLPASSTELNNSSGVIPCSTLNISILQVVTFDLFGALMLTDVSLSENICAILPSLSLADINNFTQAWRGAYKSYFGQSFSSSVTHKPFQWVIRSSLLNILDSFGLSNTVPADSIIFNSLLSTWEHLQPRDGAIEVLTKLSKKYRLGLLSNGDEKTLRAALRVFPSSVVISLILSSDYPFNCFKPCSQMHAQALDAVHGDKTKLLHVAGSEYDTHGACAFAIYSGVMNSSVLHTNLRRCFGFDHMKQPLSFFDL